MILDQLLASLATPWANSPASTPTITHLEIDPDAVVPGTLFVARQHWYGDTHTRLDAVIAAGAAAIVVSRPDTLPADCPVPAYVVSHDDPFLGHVAARFFNHPTDHLRVYGVTGTNGKTSTTLLLEALLRAAGERPALMGTIEYRFESHRWPAPNTTPDGLIIQRFAHHVRSLGATALVMEVSSHGLDIQRVAGVSFDVVGFTNLTPEHLDYHGTMDRYRQAKRRLFSACLVASQRRGKTPHAVACVDTLEGEHMLEATPPGTTCHRVATTDREADWIARDVMVNAAGTRFTLCDPVGNRCVVTSPLWGDFNVANLLLALAMVDASHRNQRAVVREAIATLPAIPGRLERVASPDQQIVVVDYAHTPDALARALAVMRTLDQGAVSVVFGCGGERDPGKRGPMMRAALDGAARVIVTNDNPRGEDPDAILDAMMQVVREDEMDRVIRIPDRRAAIRDALDHARGPVLIAGKGHERVQIIGDQRHPFDDREVAKALLRSMAANVGG